MFEQPLQDWEVVTEGLAAGSGCDYHKVVARPDMVVGGGLVRVETVDAAPRQGFSELRAQVGRERRKLGRKGRDDVVKGHVTPDQFGSAREFKTMEGETVKAAKMGSVYEVNTASVVCGNIATANATVYVINTVLEPMHMH